MTANIYWGFQASIIKRKREKEGKEGKEGKNHKICDPRTTTIFRIALLMPNFLNATAFFVGVISHYFVPACDGLGGWQQKSLPVKGSPLKTAIYIHDLSTTLTHWAGKWIRRRSE